MSEEQFKCECLECGHKFTSKKHCIDTKCPECGAKTRRAERPGAGKEKRNNDVDMAETTNSPPWGDIKKNKENFPNKSQFIIQRGEKRSDWKLPYKVKSGKIHCGCCCFTGCWRGKAEKPNVSDEHRTGKAQSGKEGMWYW